MAALLKQLETMEFEQQQNRAHASSFGGGGVVCNHCGRPVDANRNEKQKGAMPEMQKIATQASVHGILSPSRSRSNLSTSPSILFKDRSCNLQDIGNL